jgi:hypothetical protein
VEASIDLYWLPLGAGGHFVRLNGRVYEWILAKRCRRRPLDLYHTALGITLPEGRFTVENAWPIPNGDPVARGVMVEGPVWHRELARFRVFRYEVRRWSDGIIADIAEAVDSPQRVSDDENQARALLTLTRKVPAYVWGRDELHIGEMWNSNSVVAWLLTATGIPAVNIRPPNNGRAPGWTAGAVEAERLLQPVNKKERMS